jgi:hypothetical protein
MGRLGRSSLVLGALPPELHPPVPPPALSEMSLLTDMTKLLLRRPICLRRALEFWNMHSGCVRASGVLEGVAFL